MLIQTYYQVSAYQQINTDYTQQSLQKQKLQPTSTSWNIKTQSMYVYVVKAEFIDLNQNKPQ